VNILASYLDRFRILLKDKSLEKKAIIESVNEIILVTLEEKDIKITNEKIVYIKGTSTLKNALFLKKKEIMALCLAKGARISDFR